MKATLFSLILFCSSVSIAENIQRFDVKKADVLFVTRLLNEVSDVTVICTSKAGRTESPALLFKNKDIPTILSILCKMTGLNFSHDAELNTFTVKTTEEYRDDLLTMENDTSDEIKNFKVRSLNLDQIAAGLEALYPMRMRLSYGLEIEDEGLGSSSGSGQSNNNSNNTRNNSNDSNNSNFNSNQSDSGSSTGSGREKGSSLSDIELTPEMISKIEIAKRSGAKGAVQKILNNFIANENDYEPPIIVVLNQEHSIISVRTSDKTAMSQISKYIGDMNKNVPQVLLEMKILELTVNDDFSSVFDYNVNDPFNNSATNLTGDGEDFLQINPGGSFGGNANNTFARGPSTFAYEFISNRVAARIEILKKDNLVETLATPMLIATNNRVGEIQFTRDEVFTTGFEYTSAQTDDSGNVTIPAVLTTETQQEEVGLILRIRPSINEDNTVTLNVYQEDSSKISDGGKIPVSIDGTLQDQLIDIKNETTTQTTVIARDNKMIAIGGLVRTENVTSTSKVPVLGDIPLLGYFFRDEVTNNRKTELVLLITPHIMKNSDESHTKSVRLIEKTSDHNFHEKGQKGLDEKNSNLKEYKNPTKNPIRDFIKDPFDKENDSK